MPTEINSDTYPHEEQHFSTEEQGDSKMQEWDIMGDLTRGYLVGLLIGIPFGSFITWCLAVWYIYHLWFFMMLSVGGLIGFVIMCLYLILAPMDTSILVRKNRDLRKGLNRVK